MRALQAELAQDGKQVSVVQRCQGFGIPRRKVYYRPHPRRRQLDKVIQRILQIKGWQVYQRPRGHRPRAQGLPSVAPTVNQRWATDLTMVWCGRDRWGPLALVIDCGSRELLGWRLSARGHAKTPEAALEEALIHRLGHLGRVSQPLVLRSDNGLVCTSRAYRATVRAYGLTQEFITPATPEQNGVVERFVRTLKEECIWQHRFESIRHAQRVIGQWIRSYNHDRPHQARGYRPLARATAFIA